MGSSSVGTSNITFLGLRNNWNEVSFSGGSDPGTTNISLSEFRNATFTDGTTVPSTGEISIKDDLEVKHLVHLIQILQVVFTSSRRFIARFYIFRLIQVLMN